MNILLIDAQACFLDYAFRCEAAGHNVRVYMAPDKDGSPFPIGNGLLTKVADWRPSMKWADIILTSDNVKYTRELDSYRTRGFPLWAPTAAATQWELDRGVGQRILEDHGISCLPSTVFSNYDDAIKYQLANKTARFVSKPLGDADRSMSYVSKDYRDMVFMLNYWKKTQKKCPSFLFQKFTPGVEMAVGGWVGRNGFLSHFLENFEFKKLMNDDVGVNTGEMGTVIRYVTAEQSQLARDVLLPLEPELIRQNYTGYIDVAVIVGEDGQPWPLEFTSRPGWPLYQIQQILHPEPVNWMLDAINGYDTFTPYNDIAVGVVVGMPDFPYGKKSRADCSGFPVWGINDSNRYYIHPAEMKLGAALDDGGMTDMLVTAGEYVLVVTGNGTTVLSARDAAYKHLKEIEIPNSPIYRTDIGCRLEAQLPKLQQFGYAESWKWK